MPGNPPKEQALLAFSDSGEAGLDRFLDSLENRETLVGLCSDLLLHFYWDQKDLWLALKYGTRGLSASQASGMNPAAPDTRPSAKVLSYNIASFTWPGWDEPGITIGDQELDIGLGAARTNLRLARELHAGPLAEGRALWMLGCHLLARRDHAAALARFEAAVAAFQDASKPDEELLALGFQQLTRLLGGEPAAATAMRDTLGRLRQLEHGAVFAGQIETAHRCFGEPG